MGWWDYSHRKPQPRQMDCRATAQENDLGNVLAVNRLLSGF
jgi:hypothetical protein